MRYALVLAALALVALASVACGSGEPERRTIAASDLTLEQVYANMAGAMTRDGHVLHGWFRTVSTAEERVPPYEIEFWLDLPAETARVRIAALEDPEQFPGYEEIIAAGARHELEDGVAGQRRRPLTCHGATSAVLSVVLRCHGFTEESSTTVETGEYDGREAVVLKTAGESRGSDETFVFVDLLYVDAETWLPLALDTDGTVDIGEIIENDLLAEYEFEFVERSSLDPGFFDPAANGYVKADPAAALEEDAGIPVYWLGRDFAAPGLPSLALYTASVHTDRDPRLPPSFLAEVDYRSAADEFAPPLLSLQQFRPADWQALDPDSSGHVWNDPGVTREEIQLADRRAVLVKLARPSFERYLAMVHFPETVVLVGDFDAPSPYNNREAMLEVIKALRPYPQ